MTVRELTKAVHDAERRRIRLGTEYLAALRTSPDAAVALAFDAACAAEVTAFVAMARTGGVR